MVEETIKDLDPRLRKQLENAEKSLARNPSYAVDICTGILTRHPGCYEVRQILRNAQEKTKGGKGPSSIGRFFKGVASAPWAMKAGKMVKTDPKQVLIDGEIQLNQDPNNISAHKLIGQAAEALEMWETAVLAYQSIQRVDPANTENRLTLAKTLIAAGRPRDAIKVADQIMSDQPSNEQAQDIVRKAAVAETLDKGKWEEGGDYRSKLADEEQSIQLEQASRVTNDEGTLRKLISEGLKKLELEPEDLNVLRDVVSHYRTLGEYDNALEYAEKARSTPSGRGDTTLDKLVMDIRTETMKAKISEKEKAAAASPEDAQLQQELEDLRKEEGVFRLQTSKEYVEKYPNDFAARFELGKLYFEQGKNDDAVQQFQFAQRNPKVRVQAILFLGRAYLAKKFTDLAIEQLEIAKKETPIMNDLKKEAIYELGKAFELKGDEPRAIEEFKAIYAADIGYRDVADRVNAFYEKQQANS